MRNPRDILIRAYQTAGRDIEDDYFPYSFPLEVGTLDKPKVTKLAKVITDSRNSTADMNNALTIYRNLSNRIFLEGLLVYFTVDELCSVQNFNRRTLETYTEYFFHNEELKSFDSRMIFINSISSPEAKAWFLDCSTREFEDIKFRLTGTPRKDAVMKDTMMRVFTKVASVSESFLAMEPTTLQKFKEGLPSEFKFMYDIGLKSADISLKIYTILSKQSEDDANEEDFIKSWEEQVKTVNPEAFDNDLGEAQEQELLFLMDQVNPLKQANTSEPSSN